MDIKYHINGKGEVHRCTAKVRCRFGGESGKENHYSTPGEAQAAAQKQLKANYGDGAMESVQRTVASPQFTRNREAIRDALKKYGGVANAASLPEVTNVRELVAEWFDGDRARYTTFKQVAEADDITDETKKSIGSFFKAGITVNLSEAADTVPAKRTASKFAASEIDVLDDSATGGLDRDALLSGNLRAFG